MKHKKHKNKKQIVQIQNGTELYQALIQTHTTINKTPQEIHNIGLSEGKFKFRREKKKKK